MVMSKQQEAPGELERVRAYVNTLDIEAGTDALERPDGLATWLTDEGLAPDGLAPTSGDLRRAIQLREALRAILVTHNDAEPIPQATIRILDAAADRARLRLHFDESCSTTLEPAAAGVDGALGRLLAIVHDSIARGSWERLKACRLDSCAWAFYDHTKNHSGAWCNMAVCGNRAKARTYRDRRRADLSG
jgi:predicted RNA-binding Zn ribbon-like protein